MTTQRRWLVLLLRVAVVAALIGAAGCTAWRIGEARDLAQRSEPLHQAPPDAVQRLLIVGDSLTNATIYPADLAERLTKSGVKWKMNSWQSFRNRSLLIGL